METKVDRDGVYAPSSDVVAREIEGELIIVPVIAGIGDEDDELYTLNETGKDVWTRLDGRNSLNDVILELVAEYDVDEGVIRRDVVGLVEELVKREIVVPVKSDDGAPP
ncbi:PqqD family protein [Planctomycetota bacterium]